MPLPINFPNDIQVLHYTSPWLQHLNERFDLFKLYDTKKKAFLEKAFDKNKKEVDFAKILKKEDSLRFEKYGKLHPVLFNVLKKSKDEDMIAVSLWFKLKYEEPAKTEFKPSELFDTIPKSIQKLRTAFAGKFSALLKETLSEYKLEYKPLFDHIPVVNITASKKNILKIVKNKNVGAIFLYETEIINDLSNSMAIARADNVVNTVGWKATGIKVAVWENGPDDLSLLDIEEHFEPTRVNQADHARLVCGIIKNIEKELPNGYAPECRLFSANAGGLEALTWAVYTKKCRVINQSFHRPEEQTSGELSVDDWTKDRIIYNFPYPTIIQAAGNTGQSDDTTVPPESEFVNHKGYNSLTVGNHNDSATSMHSKTTFRNPVTAHGDRELPEISANGTTVSAVGLTKSGTSFSSPAVAGSVALLQSIHADLLIWPESSRAILLAGAFRNVRDNLWGDDLGSIDAKDGSGALDVKNAADIAYNRLPRNNEPDLRGWVGGRLDSNDFKDGMSTFSYNIKIPRRDGIESPNRKADRVKVALTWNSKTGVTASKELRDVLTLDLDLHVFDGDILVASSTSFDNSYEIVEFDARPGRNLTIKIGKWSGDDWSYYGVAWTVIEN